MDWDKVQEFLRIHNQKERPICTYWMFLEELERIQSPKWKLIQNKIRSADDSHRSPLQVLAGFYSAQSPLSPRECAAALRLEMGEELALVIMKAEDYEWMDEPLMQSVRKDLLIATKLSDEDNAAGALAVL